MRELAESFRQAPGAMTLLRGPERILEMADPAYLQQSGKRDTHL